MAKQIKKYGKIALVFGLVIMLTGIYALIPSAKAASVTSRSDTLSDSRPSVTPDHDIKFKMDAATSIANAETVTIQFQSFTSGSSGTVIGDWTILHDADGVGTYTALTPSNDWTFTDAGASTANPLYTFTFTSTAVTAIGSDKYIQIQLTNAANKLPSPTAGVYDVDIAGNFGDTGTMKVAIIAGVTVSATVAETLTASINGIAPAACTINGGTEITTTPTTIPFSTINGNTFYDGCQRLDISTNASNGYSATIQETDQLTSGSDQIADGSCTGTSCTDSTAGAWGTATDNGFGYCMDDVTGTDANVADSAWGTNGCGATTQNFKTIADAGASETAQAIMSNTGAVSNNQAYVGFRLSVSGSQPAGSYSNSIVYVVTPTY